MINYYQILELKNNATNEEIKLAYKKLAKKYHPDGNNDYNNEELFKLINDAYNTLINENTRKHYNKELEIINNNRSYYSDTFDDFDLNYNDYTYEKEYFQQNKWNKKKIIYSLITIYILISLLTKILL